jgi:hypothetical protein
MVESQLEVIFWHTLLPLDSSFAKVVVRRELPRSWILQASAADAADQSSLLTFIRLSRA